MNKVIKVISSTLLSGLLLAQTVLANEIELATKVQACSQISENKARLNCFDQLTTKPGTQVLAPKTAELTVQEVDSFSKEQVKKTAEEKATEINRISLTISKLDKTAYGKWKITFVNGQKWQQKDSTKLKLKLGEQVILTKGALSAVFLQKENANKRIKVKRLK